MKLHYLSYGSGPSLFILHGLFGLADNWVTVAKMLSPWFNVICVNLRNHGKSPESDEMSFQLMADDLKDLFDALKTGPSFLIGHSMGGKAAIQFAHDFPESVRKLIVVDVTMKAFHADKNLLNMLFSFDPGKISSRTEADKIFSSYINSRSAVQLFLKNLYRDKNGKLAWKFNAKSILRNMKTISAAIEPGHTINVPTLFIRGGNSGFILDEDKPLIKQWIPTAKFVTVNGAGHWVHADKPVEFTRVVKEFLL